MNLLDQSTTWLADKLKASAGRAVTYRRGVGTSVSLTATRMSEDEQAVDETGAYVVVRQHAFVLTYADLGLEPRPGDRIEELLLGVTAVAWEVVPHAGGPSWQWEDAGKILIRVFVKQVS